MPLRGLLLEVVCKKSIAARQRLSFPLLAHSIRRSGRAPSGTLEEALLVAGQLVDPFIHSARWSRFAGGL